MRIVYFDCIAGASGDMLLAALLAAGASEDAMRAALSSLELPGLAVQLQPVMRGAISALSVRITCDDDATERRLSDMAALVARPMGLWAKPLARARLRKSDA